MRSRTLRSLPIAFSLAISALALFALPAAATVNGAGCSATGTGGYQGPIDLTTRSTWNVHHEDSIGGTGKAPKAQSSVTVSAVILGVQVPLVNNSGGGKSSGSGGPFPVSKFDTYIRVINVAGASDDCSGHVTLVVDNVSPFTTVAGIASILIAVLGSITVLLQLTRVAGIGSRIFGAIGGLLVGFGLSFLLVQTGTLDGTSIVGVIASIITMIVGAAVPGLVHRPPTAA